MKLALCVFGLLVVGVIVLQVIGTIPKSSATEENRSGIEARGLPEHGILVILPGDPTFNTLTEDFLKSTPGADSDALKRSSVFLVNGSDRGIAAIDLKWELVQPDGQTIVQHRALNGPLEVVNDVDSPHFEAVIPASGNKLFSLLNVAPPHVT